MTEQVLKVLGKLDEQIIFITDNMLIGPIVCHKHNENYNFGNFQEYYLVTLIIFERNCKDMRKLKMLILIRLL